MTIIMIGSGELKMKRRIIAIAMLLTFFTATNIFAAELTIDSISEIGPGGTVVISGSTSMDEISIKVMAPNRTILYIDVVKGPTFNTTFDLPENAEEGTYTIIAGRDSEVATVTFNAKSGDAKVPVSGVSLDKTASTIKVGETLQLSAEVIPTNATNKAVTWQSNNTSIATVDQTGKVTGVKAGTAIITVTTRDGNFSAECSITVTNPSSGGSGGSGGGSSGGSQPAKETDQPKEEVKEETPTTTTETEQGQTPSSQTADFKDTAEHWAREAINKLVKEGIISGYPDGTFRPNAEITRAEFVTLICRMLGLEPINSPSKFKDVDSNAWYAGYINAIREAGMIGGYEDGTFKPNQKITREEGFVILYRMAKAQLSASGSNPNFTDDESIAAWAREAVEALVSAGVVSGYEDGTIKPKNNITRAETVKILSFFLQ
jgi:hypothetical protein